MRAAAAAIVSRLAGEEERERQKKGDSNTPKEHKVIYASSTRTLACELVTLTPRTRAFSRMVTRLRAETVDAISAAKLQKLGVVVRCGKRKESFCKKKKKEGEETKESAFQLKFSQGFHTKRTGHAGVGGTYTLEFMRSDSRSRSLWTKNFLYPHGRTWRVFLLLP